MKPILILSIFLSHFLMAQTVKEKEMKTAITDVTVFLTSAQVFESGTMTIPQGKTLLRVKDLSPYLDEKSIQVKTDADLTILSVNHRFNFLKSLKKDKEVDSLKKIHDLLTEKMTDQLSRNVVLGEKKKVLSENRRIRVANNGPTLDQLRQAVNFFDIEFQKIADEETGIGKTIATITEEQKRLEKQLKEAHEKKFLPSSEIEIMVSAEHQATAKFTVSYLVGNAGWFPKYDVRVSDIKKPLSLTYKAEVHQSTGVEWKNVKLKFSNGNPMQSGLIPELNTWSLSYARFTRIDKPGYGLALTMERNVRGIIMDENGDPIPGVNVVAKGTSVGTVTDVNGNYSITIPNGTDKLVYSFIGYGTEEMPISQEMNVSLKPDVAMLSEVVVTAYGVEKASHSMSMSSASSGINIRGANSVYGNRASGYVTTTFVENQTTVEVVVETPYTVKSNGEKLVVDLRKYEIDANYQYYAVPKLDKDAFLIAQITNWDQYNLLEGEANLYFEDSYIGRSVLDAKALKDTLTISLGRDKNIVIGRTKTEFSKQRTMGSNRVDTRAFKTTIRNKKSQPINLKIFDHVPVAVINDISVSITELSHGTLDEKAGKVSWELVVDPLQQKELLLQYDVRYPKREKVILE